MTTATTGPRTTPNPARVLVAVWAMAAGLGASVANAGVTHQTSGVSVNGTPVAFAAEMTITEDTLTVVLRNESVGTPHPSDLLTSLYFDIRNGAGDRPSLSYVSAVGDVWRTDKNGPDALETAAADLVATARADNTWQFRVFDAGLAPFQGFGVGTVGNSNLEPGNFNGNIVGGRDYGVYVGDVASSNLHNTLLVKSSITFVFAGVSGFTEADIGRVATFGMGTGPDSLLRTTSTTVVVDPIPAPGSGVLAAIGGGLLLRRRRR